MSNQPTTEERALSIPSTAGASVAYICLIIGYLLTILTTTRLTPFNFLVFTALQVCYCALLWWMIWVVGKIPKKWPLPLALGLLVVITGAIGVLPITVEPWRSLYSS